MHQQKKKFKKISEAFEDVYRMMQKRQIYQFGHAMPFNKVVDFKIQVDGQDPFDMFNQFFGGGGGATFSGFNGFFTRENGKA